MEIYDVRVSGAGRAPSEVRKAAIEKAVARLTAMGGDPRDAQSVLAEAILHLAFFLACSEVAEKVGPAEYALLDLDIVETDEDAFPVCAVSVGINPTEEHKEEGKVVFSVALDEADCDACGFIRAERTCEDLPVS